MNNKDMVSMQSVVSLVKYLVDRWRESKCPDYLLSDDCCECKYKEICAKIEELARVVKK